VARARVSGRGHFTGLWQELGLGLVGVANFSGLGLGLGLGLLSLLG